MPIYPNISTFKNWYMLYLVRNKMIHSEVVLETKNGEKILVRPNTEDASIAKSVFVKQHYVKNEYPITKESTVVDVGANIGAFSILAGFRAKFVVAIEPESSNFLMLKRNLEINKLVNVKALEMAISGSSGKRKLYLGDTGSSGGHSLFNENRAASNIKEVSTVSIEDLMTELKIERIDFLKLDCEGAENEIIDSLNYDTASRILNIVMEFHKVDNRKPTDMIKKLHDLGYQTKSEDDGGYIYSKRL